MREILVIITILVSNNLFAQNFSTKSFGSAKIESPDCFSLTKDINEDENEKVQKRLIDSTNPRNNKPFGINFNIGGPSILFSVSGDYFITSSLNIEAGVGFIGLFGGLKYHLNGNKPHKNWTPYLGLYATRIPSLPYRDPAPRNGLYIPLGMQYISKNGFTFGVEVAGITLKDITGGTNIWGAIKLGYHF